jgi:hypothetical protein
MSIRRSRRIRTATVLAAITAATLTAAGSATASPVATADGSPVAAAPADPTGPDDSLPDVSADAGGWPAELKEHTRLFVNPYRSYTVQIRDGEPTLVLSTGFDSCYFMTQHGEQRYPC